MVRKSRSIARSKEAHLLHNLLVGSDHLRGRILAYEEVRKGEKVREEKRKEDLAIETAMVEVVT